MLYDCGWNLSEVSRRPPAPADVIHLSYSGSRLLYSKSEKVTEGFNQVSPSTPKPFSLARARTGANGGIARRVPRSRLGAAKPPCRSSACTKAAGRRTIDSRSHAAL